MTQKDIEQAAKDIADYLYKIEGECPPELYEAISMLRQFINEEFKPAKLISNQIIYDILYPKLSEAFVSKDEILEARPAYMHSESPEMLNEGWVDHEYIAYNLALKDWSKALGIGETE